MARGVASVGEGVRGRLALRGVAQRRRAAVGQSAKPINRYLEILLDKWMPAIIGGIFVAVLVPIFQSHFASQTEFEKQRHALWLSTGENFTGYLNAYIRLNEASRFEAGQGRPSEDFLTRKDSYRKERDEYATKLSLNLLMAGFYFGKEVRDEVDRYLAFRQKYRIATIDQLPSDDDVRAWRTRLMTVIRRDLERR